VRSEAITALWRLGRASEAPQPSARWIRSWVHEEIERLRHYAAVEGAVPQYGPFRAFFHQELEIARLQAEARVFRLLGILYDRAALYRAWLHYRSPVVRVRSNAIELLDQHVQDPSLKPFVGLVERVDDEKGEDRLRTVNLQRLVPKGEIEDLLGQVEPWLRRLWSWTISREREPDRAFGWNHAIDRVFQLKAVPLFEGMSGEQLLTLAERSTRREWAIGERLFEEGSRAGTLYLVQSGSVEILRGTRLVSALTGPEVVGELAILDDASRNVTARVVSAARIVEVPREAFQELLDLYPALGRAAMRLLVKRLRELAQGPG
jgi:hypothetical protein